MARARRIGWPVRLLVAAALVVDALVHLRLAGAYDGVRGALVSQGTLFRAEGVVALLAALATVFGRGRSALLLAFAVLASALAAVLLYRYVAVGPLAGLPDMYEPTWFPEKTVSAVAEGLGALLALLALLGAVPGGRRGRGG